MKNEIKPWLVKEWCIPEADAEFVAKMEDVLEVYQADVFMISEPLAGRRETVVTQTRTALDFAEILRYISDTLYPGTEK